MKKTKLQLFTGMLAICMVFLFTAKAQNDINPNDLKSLQSSEKQLITLADSMYNEVIPELREVKALHFIKLLVLTLRVPYSYEYGFDSLNTKINVVYPEDKSFRIFNWSVQNTENTQRYYGAIQMPSANLKLYPLIDVSESFQKGAEDSVFTTGKWYGALYYRIMDNTVNGEKIYTLFGINNSSPISTKKLLDPLQIAPNGPVFGAQVFAISSQIKKGEKINRFVLEYKKGIQASMNWEPEQKAIFFDRLESEANDPNRKYTFVPTGQYDGLRWDGRQYVFVKDLIEVVNRKDGEAPSPEPVTPK